MQSCFHFRNSNFDRTGCCIRALVSSDVFNESLHRLMHFLSHFSFSERAAFQIEFCWRGVSGFSLSPTEESTTQVCLKYRTRINTSMPSDINRFKIFVNKFTKVTDVLIVPFYDRFSNAAILFVRETVFLQYIVSSQR